LPVKSRWLAALVAMAFAGSGVRAEHIEYRISGLIQKEPISDRLFGSSSDRVRFEIDVVADMRQAIAVPAGVKTTLPSFDNVVLQENGLLLPAPALQSLAFRLSSGSASFGLADVIANPATGGSVFLTGTATRPTGINILLANSASGQFEAGIVQCKSACVLKGGLVLDAAGPFGTIDELTVTVVEHDK
jgi:hypothetical protein